MASVLRKKLFDHLRDNEQCQTNPPIIKHADEANRLNGMLLRNQNVTENGRTGDVEQFYKRDRATVAYQCSGCKKLFLNSGKASKHIKNIDECHGSNCVEVGCRETQFGTLCLPPANKRRCVVTPIPMVASFDAVDLPPPLLPLHWDLLHLLLLRLLLLSLLHLVELLFIYLL